MLNRNHQDVQLKTKPTTLGDAIFLFVGHLIVLGIAVLLARAM